MLIEQKRKKITTWIVHPLTILIVLLLSYLIIYDKPSNNWKAVIVTAITDIAEFYFSFFLVAPFLFNIKISKFLGILLLFLCTSCVSQLLLFKFIVSVPLFSNSNSPLPFEIGIALLVAVAIFFASWGVYIVIKHYELLIGNYKNIMRKQQVELSLLRLQMNPHFMFNALNNLNHLIRTGENEKAMSYNAEICRLLNWQLEHVDKDFVSLEEEFEWLKDYLITEQKRIPGVFNFDLQIKEDEIAMQNIPLMLLQPLVENSIVHGFRGAPEQKSGMIRIYADKIDATSIIITLEDNGMGINAEKVSNRRRKSISLVNIENRIQLINEAGRFTITFNMELHDTGMQSSLVIKENDINVAI